MGSKESITHALVLPLLIVPDNDGLRNETNMEFSD